MYPFTIGVITDSFKTDFITAVKTAKDVQASGIQAYVTAGEMSPEELSPSKRKEILKIVKDNGLVFSALCGDLGKGFGSTEDNPRLIEKSKRIIELAKELETDVVTTHIGVVPSSPVHPRYAVMQEACGKLAAYADSLQAHFAVETGPETAAVLKVFLDSLGSKGVAVNLDPANFVMVTGDDPVKAVYTLREYIVHTHAKDGLKLCDVDPEVLYGLSDAEMLTSKAFEEVPLGKGNVDFDAYLYALSDIGYRGFLTIERELGENPQADIANAVRFLQEKIK